MIKTPDILGAPDVVAWFGRWPSFHDAEIVSLHLHRSEPSVLMIHAWNMTDKVDESGHYVIEKQALVSFTLVGVSDLDLADFSVQNVISSLEIEKREAGFRITLRPCYGLCGTLDAESVSVNVAPWKTETANIILEGIPKGASASRKPSG